MSIERLEALHFGRSWASHPLEDACACPKAPCGLISGREINESCPEHALSAMKTIRQSHPEEACPGVPA